MYSNLPDGCTDEDIEVYYTGRPMSEEKAKETIRELLLDEGFSDDEITEELLEESFKENWSLVHYSRRNGGTGYVCFAA